MLETFGQSGRTSICACDTRKNSTLHQILHLLFGETVPSRVKVAAGGALRTIVEKHSTPEEIIDAMLIRTVSRRPTSDEMQPMRRLVAEGTPPEVYEDIFAGLLASSEFMLIR